MLDRNSKKLADLLHLDLVKLGQMRATAWLQSCCCLILVSRSLASLRQHVHFKGDLAAWSAAGQTLTDLWSGCSRGQRYRCAARTSLQAGDAPSRLWVLTACACGDGRFVRYEPSAWEAEVSSEEPCQRVASAAPKVSGWLSGVQVRTQCTCKHFGLLRRHKLALLLSAPAASTQEFNGSAGAEDAINSRVPAARNETFLSHFDEAIFSRMIYRNVCPGERLAATALEVRLVIQPVLRPAAQRRWRWQVRGGAYRAAHRAPAAPVWCVRRQTRGGAGALSR